MQEASMTAGALMTTYPVTVTPQATIAEALDLMRDLDIRHLPVVDGGALVGMLSDRDLAYLNVGALLTDQGADALRRELATPVIKVMRSDVICVEPETELSDVVGLLLEHKIGAIPVIRPDTQAVVGIVSYIDVLRAVQDLLEDEESS
jgi:acetoin utilization protein AcuB